MIGDYIDDTDWAIMSAIESYYDGLNHTIYLDDDKYRIDVITDDSGLIIDIKMLDGSANESIT
jgi:hypothetical protein